MGAAPLACLWEGQAQVCPMKPVLLGSPGQCTHLERSPGEVTREEVQIGSGEGKHSWLGAGGGGEGG